jgi:tetratricopeptide (TPR) repeat protein
MKYIKIIEHLTLDKVSEMELNDFNLQLIIDPILRNEYDKYNQSLNIISEQEADLREAIYNSIDFEFNINAAFESLSVYPQIEDDRLIELSKLIRATIIKGRCGSQNGFKGWLKAAAVFIFIFLATLPSSESFINKPAVICLSNFKYIIYTPSVTRGKANKADAMVLAWSYYSQNNIDSALIVMDSLGFSPHQEADWVIFKSACLMEKHDYEEALRVLDKLPDDCLMKITSLWYKAICYINLQRKDEAILQLEEIARIDSISRRPARKVKYLLHTYPLLEVDFYPSKYLWNGTYRF